MVLWPEAVRRGRLRGLSFAPSPLRRVADLPVAQVVGGTGISPAFQYIESTLSHPANPSAPQPSIKVVYASPSPSRILLKPELDALVAQHPEKLSVQYLVDNLEAGQKKSSVPETTVGRMRAKELKKWIGEGSSKEKKRAVIVCGPEQ